MSITHSLWGRTPGILLQCYSTLDIVAWTLAVMMSTNYQPVLIAGTEVEASVSAGGFDGLMGRWQVFNGIRGLFLLAGGISGLVVALC